MRRALLVFLLFLLPLQFSWAAAAAYCDHEEGTMATHFGHHQHNHHSPHRAVAGDPVKDSKAKVPFGDDNDCVFCHLACAQAMFSGNTSLPALAPSRAEFSYQLDFRSHIPPPPYTPVRRLAA
jgi:hypothetical protein